MCQIYNEGDILYPLTYDFARFADSFKVVRLPVEFESEITDLFLCVVSDDYTQVIFGMSDVDIINRLFTSDRERAYRFTPAQQDYVNEWYR